MPVLHNIDKFNNTVIIQSSVTMYTDVYSVLSFSITEGSTGPVSSDLKKHFVQPSDSHGVPAVVSVHVFASVVCPAAVRVSQHGLRKAPVILSYVTHMSGCI